MALTPELEASIAAQIEGQKILNAENAARALELDNRHKRLAALEIAKQVLLENARTKPVESRNISVDDITNFANTLYAYVTE